jgi:tetratricopeptide (TPR) repeat protein
VLKQRDELVGRGFGNLSPTDLAALGAIQWRLRDSDSALTTLKQAAGRDPRNFWVLTHLGSVHQALGQYREGSSPLESARDFFPDPWPVGPPAAGDWFKKAEGYQLKLLRLRLPENSFRTSGRPMPAADVDRLFGVRFVGPSGQYEAGKLADAERTKLPADAVAVVQQLLLWFPDDTRLLWLLGELYNAQGDLEAASKILDDCVWQRRYDSPALREHRQIVQEAYEAQVKAATPPPQEPPKPVILPGTWQVYAVGIGFGLVLAVLAYFQVGQLLRRLRRPVPPST